MLDANMSTPQDCPVNSHNEWDPLEEVIVGNVAGAMYPNWDVISNHTMPPGQWDKLVEYLDVHDAAYAYPPEYIDAARRDLTEFLHILDAEGVTIRRNDELNYDAPFGTPDWKVSSGFCGANPRDPFLIIGNEIIETPMADRNRYFEAWSYRTLFKEYFKRGAKWTAAPKPQLLDALYDPHFSPPPDGEPNRFVLTEFEPAFDAADFVRCGRDIFGQLSHVTNRFGVEWLQRHLGENYHVHLIESKHRQAEHIDTTFMPLAPGKVMVNPEYLDLDNLPPLLKKWDLLIAPHPDPARQDPISEGMSRWINMNMLMLDEERVIVEKKQVSMIKALKNWGFKPIPCSFENYYPFYGSFHCATLDVRRRGKLQSYF